MHASSRRYGSRARASALLVLCAGLFFAKPSTATANERRRAFDDPSESLALPLDRPISLSGRNIAEYPSVDSAVAARAVEAYVTELETSGERPEWRGTTVRHTATFRTSTGTPLMYEYTLDRDGVAVAAVYAGATTGTTAITAYIPEGRSMSAVLLAQLADALATSVDPERATFYYSGNEQYGISYALPADDLLPQAPDVLAVPETRTVYYAPDFVAQTVVEWSEHFTPTMKVTKAWAMEQDAVRTELVTAGESHRGQMRSLGLIPATVKREVPGGRSSFPSFYQDQKRKWSNGTCYAGCTAVAAAALFEYWDRNGYPKLIGTDSANRKHTYASETDVLKALDEIRSALGTYCANDKVGTGLTQYKNIPTGMAKYAAGKGYKTFSSDNVSWFRWINIIDEVNAGRPSMLSFTQNGATVGHTVTVYGYSDAFGISNDTICTMWGWDSQITKCFNVYSSTEDWSYLTRVRSK